MEYYIYFNGYSYETCTHEESIGHISGLDVVFCSSFFWKESFENLNNYGQNSGTKRITPYVLNEILKKKNEPNYSQYFSSSKEYFLKSLKISSTGTDPNLIKDKIGDSFDVEPSLIRNNNAIVLCADIHEAANNLYRVIPYLYKIDKGDLKKYNGLKNYRKSHIKKVQILVKEIKNKIINHENL